MTDHICELGDPSIECYDLQEYLSNFVDSVGLLDNVRTGQGDTPQFWNDMWLNCIPPTASALFWFYTDTTTGALDTHNIIRVMEPGGAWLGYPTTSPAISPYYMLFEGDFRPLTEGWVGSWFIDGNGSALPDLTFDTFHDYITNGDFEEFTGAIPDDWAVTTGTTAQEALIVYEGLSSVELIAAVAIAQITQAAVAVPAYGWYKLTAQVYPSEDANSTMGISTSTGFLGNSGTITQQEDWYGVSLTDYATALSNTVHVDGNQGAVWPLTGYADAVTLQQITDGWFTLKEFYSAYGTFTMDFTLTTNDYAGFLLNYVPIASLYTDDAAFFMLVANQDEISLIQQTDINTVSVIGGPWAYTYVPGATLEAIVSSLNTITINYNSIFVAARAPTLDPLGTRHGMIATTEYAPIQAFTYEPE